LTATGAAGSPTGSSGPHEQESVAVAVSLDRSPPRPSSGGAGPVSARATSRRRSSSGAGLDLPFASLHHQAHHKQAPSSNSASAAGSPVPLGFALTAHSPSSISLSAAGSPAALASLPGGAPPPLLSLGGPQVGSSSPFAVSGIPTAKPSLLLINTTQNPSPAAFTSGLAAGPVRSNSHGNLLVVPHVKAALSPIRERPIGAPGSALPSVSKPRSNGERDGGEDEDGGFAVRLFEGGAQDAATATGTARTGTSSGTDGSNSGIGIGIASGSGSGSGTGAGKSAPGSRASPKAFKPVAPSRGVTTAPGVASKNRGVKATRHRSPSPSTADTSSSSRSGSSPSSSSPSSPSSGSESDTESDGDGNGNAHDDYHYDDRDEDGGISLLNAPAVTAYEASARILRRENFLTALVSNGALGGVGSLVANRSSQPTIFVPLPRKAAFTTLCGLCRRVRAPVGSRHGYTAIASDREEPAPPSVAVNVAPTATAVSSERAPLLSSSSSSSRIDRRPSAVLVPPAPPPYQPPPAAPRTALGLLNNDRSELLRRQRTASSASAGGYAYNSASADDADSNGRLSVPLMTANGTAATATAGSANQLFLSPPSASSSSASASGGHGPTAYNSLLASPSTTGLTTTITATPSTLARPSTATASDRAPTFIPSEPQTRAQTTADGESLFFGYSLAIPPSLYYSSLFEWCIKALILSDLWSPEGKLYRSRLSSSATTMDSYSSDTTSSRPGTSANAFYLRTVRARLRLAGLIGILISPVLFLLSLLHFAIWTLGDVKASGNYLGPRKWTLHALRLLREYNELPHALQRRLAPSFSLATRFLSLSAERQSPLLTLAARLLLLVSGAALAFVLLLGLLDESILLHTTLLSRNLLWWVAVLGALVGVSRKLASSDNDADESSEGHLAADTSAVSGPSVANASALSRSMAIGKAGAGVAPAFGLRNRTAGAAGDHDEARALPLTAAEETLRLLALHTHYLPQEWSSSAETEVKKTKESSLSLSAAQERWSFVQTARRSLQELFQYRLLIFVAEMLAPFVTPLFLLFYLPNRVDSLLTFVLVHSTHERLPSLSSPRENDGVDDEDGEGLRQRRGSNGGKGDDNSSVTSESTTGSRATGGGGAGGINSLGDICCYASLDAGLWARRRKQRRRDNAGGTASDQEGEGGLAKWQRSALAFATENPGVTLSLGPSSTKRNSRHRRGSIGSAKGAPGELLQRSILGRFESNNHDYDDHGFEDLLRDEHRQHLRSNKTKNKRAHDNEEQEEDDRYRLGVGNPSGNERKHWRAIATEGLHIAVMTDNNTR
jgi:Autophagy protein ATG9